MNNRWKKIYKFLGNWKQNRFPKHSITNLTILSMHDLKEEEEEEIKVDELDTISHPSFTADILNAALDEDDDDDDDGDDDEYKTHKTHRNEIPRFHDDEDDDKIRDRFPCYIYKSIWDKSDDEMVEMLVDDCCKKVEKSMYWNDIKYIQMLYKDGIQIMDDDIELMDDDNKIYWDFVKNVYKEAGGNKFFDKFISENYKREISIWKSTIEKERKLTDDDDIFGALQKMDFKKFDIDGNDGIDFEEFQLGFKKLGYFVDKGILRKVFDDIDKMDEMDETITRNEYNQWKEIQELIHHKYEIKDDYKYEVNEEEEKIDHHEPDKVICYVYYDHIKKLYQFIYGEEKEEKRNKYQYVAKLNDEMEGHMETHSEVKWALYVNKLNKKQKNKFKQYQENKPNGFWKILSEDEEENKKGISSKAIKEEMLNPNSLRTIYQLLHHYYMLNIDLALQKKWDHDKTPLRRLCDNKEKINDEKINRKRITDVKDSWNIRFLIDDNEYQLTWWNQKGKFQPNAMAIINITKYNKKKNDIKKPKPIELCYMRFQCNPNTQKLRWAWYDNDSRSFKNFDHKDQAVIDELEVAFLSNNKQNFDPTVFNQRFNKCLLPKLEHNLSERFPNLTNRSYMVQCTFSPDDENDLDGSNIIQNMEQITFNHKDTTSFPRNLRRFIDERDSLEFIYRKSDKFDRKWKMKYRLYTEQQQLYFFSFIVAIVSMMKYIDIEFSNQPVVIPLYKEEIEKEDIIDTLIHQIDVTREQRVSSIFKGSLISASNIWQPVSDRNAERKPSKTKILKKAVVYKYADGNIEENPGKKIEELYIQDIEDYGIRHFTKEEAEFVQLAECIRKFALEYEAGYTERCLWPWYRNSFHSDDDKFLDVEMYDELVYKFDYVKTWTIKEIVKYIDDKTERKHICDKKDKPIRFKRKFGAELLLSPQETSRNINLIRNQLDSLLNDILDDAIKEEINSKLIIKQQSAKPIISNIKDGTDKNYTKKSFEIAYKKDIEENDEDKQKVIANYCKNKINENSQDMNKYDVENINKLVDIICKLSNNNTLKEIQNNFKNYIQNKRIDGSKLIEMDMKKFANEFIKFILPDNKKEEKQNEQNLSIYQCDNKQIVNIIKKTLNESNNEKLINNKDLIISFFEQENFDGNTFQKMTRKEFAEKIIKHCNNNNKLRGAIMNLYKTLIEYRIEKEVDDNKEEKENKELENKNKNIYDGVMELCDLMIKYVSNKRFWPKQIEETNKKFKKKLEKKDEYGLLDENTKNLEELDIDRFKLPVFKEFVEFFFINTDKEQYQVISETNQIIGGRDHEFYRKFLKSWRETPSWYTYDHDILLLELILRNGFKVKSDHILNDLKGDKINEYKIRLQCDECNNIDDPYYEFMVWCSNHCNVLHRLKYVTNIIVKNLETKEYGGNISLISIRISEEIDRPKYNISSLIFTDYQKQTHCNYVKRKEIELDIEKMKKDNIKKEENNKGNNKWCCCNGILKKICKCGNYYYCCCCASCNKQPVTDIPKVDRNEYILLPKITIDELMNEKMSSDEYMPSIPGKSISYMHNRRKSRSVLFDDSPSRIRTKDPFIERDINIELLETFQTFNLMEYGEPLLKCIIDQIQRHNRAAYWYLLGELLNSMPYPLAIDAIKDEDTKAILRHTAEPEVLDKICHRLIQGASFRTSAALGVAEFFDDLATEDVVKEETWTDYRRKYERMGYHQINKVESDNLLFVLLNIPLMQHRGKSLFTLALEQERIEFLNNDRIDALLQHLYQHRFLKPEEKINMKSLSYWEMLKLVFCYPFKFYFAVQGYHWISGVLFMLYFGFIMIYVWYRPIGGKQFIDDWENNHKMVVLEIALWTMNIGYITYELLECGQKGLKQYLDFGGIQGQANILDVFICIFWITLLVMRCIFIGNETEFDGENPKNAQKAYIFLFGIQIILLTMRALALFSNSQYLGKLVKVIKLMGYEIFRFLFIFLVVMVGFLFGLWLITAANNCDYNESDSCDDYEVDNFSDGLKYVFQVFIGTGDLGGVVDEGLAIIFMVIATLFGTLILTNLLIALMTTEYENVQEAAKGEVIYNKAELTSDLSKRSRLMPPPLNILVLVFTEFLDVINFFTSLIYPSSRYSNIYIWIDHQLFFNLQNFNIWQFEYDGWERSEGTKLKYKTRLDILNWYFIAWWKDWIKDFCQSVKQKCCTNREKEHDHDSKDKNKNKKKKEKENNNDNDDDLAYWRIHHRSCYGCLVYDTGHNNVKIINETYRGITMAEYLERYETFRRQKIEAKDKELLKGLTADTLFCEYCFRPFLKNKVKDELTTPYIALLDLISAIMFVVFPVAWIPLIILFGILALKDWIFGSSEDDGDDDDEKKYYKHTDFDKEYFPNQFHTLK